MLTIEDFKDAGYSQHNAGIEQHWAMFLLQKQVTNRIGTKYYINVYPSQLGVGNGARIDFSIKLQFICDKDVINISILPRDFENVHEIEEIVKKLWRKLGANYYRKWNE